MTSALSPEERDALLRQFDALAEEAPFVPLTRRHMSQLTAIESSQAPLVSLYLDLGPHARQDRRWAIVLKNLIRDALARIDDPKQERQVASTLGRIESSVDQSLPDLGRSIALFVDDAGGLWQQIALPLALPNRLVVDRRPYLRPLFRVLDEHDRFLLAMLDNQRARLFVSQMGVVQEVVDLVEDVPARHDQGGWAQMRLQRHRDAHVQWHAGTAAHATALAMEHFAARWLLVSGSPEVLVEYRKALPVALAPRLAAEFSLPITSSPAAVAAAAEPLQLEIEAREELATVNALRDLPAGAGKVTGLEMTLRFLSEGRVKTLIALDDYRAPGTMCATCGVIKAVSSGECPACGQPLDAVDDVVDLALEQAYRQSADLELVRSAPARDRLAELDPIGALLRY